MVLEGLDEYLSWWESGVDERLLKLHIMHKDNYSRNTVNDFKMVCIWLDKTLTLKVLVTTVDALEHFKTG